MVDSNILQRLLTQQGILTPQEAMRNKDLAKLGDPLTNLIHSLAQSFISQRFEGEKVSGKTLAAALRLAKLREHAPARLDAHGLGDTVEAFIAYAWIRGTLQIHDAAELLAQEFQQAIEDLKEQRQKRAHAEALAFAALLRNIWLKEQAVGKTERQ